MTARKHVQIAPLGWLEEWRKTGDAARSIHVLLYAVWCVLGTPFSVFAYLGYGFCLLCFPAMLLGFGLSLTRHQPGWGWFLFALCALLLWTTLCMIQAKQAIQQLRARVIDLESLANVTLMTLSYLVAAWYVQIAVR